jgi:pilus assembly protein CpaB
MLIGAIVLGLLAVFVMRFYIGTGSAPSAKAVAVAPQTTNVVVATEALVTGAKIDPAKFRIVAFPNEAVPPDSFRTIAAVGQARVLAQPLDVNEPLTLKKLSGPGGGAGISMKIAPNMRAATIRVSDVLGVGGFVFPGEHVDLVVTFAAQGLSMPTTSLLAQDIRVIAVNQDANPNKDKAEVVQSVTIEVTPELAQKLALANQVGTVSLTLRNPDDQAPTKVRTIAVADLHGGYVATAASGAPHLRPARRAAHATPSESFEIVRGVERTSYQIARRN